MNLLSLCFLIALWAGVTPGQKQPDFDSAALGNKARQAYLQLFNAKKFSVGHTGYAGEKSDEDEALRLLLKNKMSLAALKSLINSAGPEGKLYGLLGLRLKHKSSYPSALSYVKSGYEPPERTSRLGILKIDDSGTIAADDLDKGIVPKGRVVTDLKGLVQIKDWNEVIADIDAGTYDKFLKKR